jgi:energy-coupling factor transport system permease protein
MGDLAYVAKYIPMDSWFHHLDPRTKLLFSALMMVFVFCCHAWTGLLLLALVIAGAVSVSRLKLYWLGQGLAAFRYIIVLTAIVQTLIYPDVPELLSLGPVAIGWASLNAAAMLSVRLILILTAAQLLLLSTSTLQMTVALEYLLKPLRVLRFPVGELVMIITIAMRFLPLILQESMEVRAAQMARGADFSQGSVISRIKKQLMIIVPIFGLSLQRVNDMACSLESRAYVPGIKRSHLHPLHLQGKDFAFLGVLAILGIVVWIFPL